MFTLLIDLNSKSRDRGPVRPEVETVGFSTSVTIAVLVAAAPPVAPAASRLTTMPMRFRDPLFSTSVTNAACEAVKKPEGWGLLGSLGLR